jgi:hypothetical protein
MLKGKLESMKLHEVVPQAPLQQHPSLAEETPTMTFSTCDDDLTNEFEQEFDLNRSIQELLLIFIFLLDRARIQMNNETSFMNLI